MSDCKLDARSERLVVEGLNKQIQGKTALMVTHQLAPLKDVEQILVLQDGKLVQTGNYDSLSTKTDCLVTC